MCHAPPGMCAHIYVPLMGLNGVVHLLPATLVVQGTRASARAHTHTHTYTAFRGGGGRARHTQVSHARTSINANGAPCAHTARCHGQLSFCTHGVRHQCEAGTPNSKICCRAGVFRRSSRPRPLILGRPGTLPRGRSQMWRGRRGEEAAAAEQTDTNTD